MPGADLEPDLQSFYFPNSEAVQRRLRHMGKPLPKSLVFDGTFIIERKLTHLSGRALSGRALCLYRLCDQTKIFWLEGLG